MTRSLLILPALLLPACDERDVEMALPPLPDVARATFEPAVRRQLEEALVAPIDSRSEAARARWYERALEKTSSGRRSLARERANVGARDPRAFTSSPGPTDSL